MNTDKENRKRKSQRPPIREARFPATGSVTSVCIRGSEQTDLRREEAHVGFEPIGYSGIHIQSEVSTPFAPASLTP
jgi:hypothetical protein